MTYSAVRFMTEEEYRAEVMRNLRRWQQQQGVHYLAVTYDLDTTIFGVFDSLTEAIERIDAYDYATARYLAVIEEWQGGEHIATHERQTGDESKWKRRTHARQT